LDELRAALGTHVEAIGGSALEGETDHFDRASARENYAADGVTVGVVVHRFLAAYIGGRRRYLESLSSPAGRIARYPWWLPHRRP
jgi:hypothetical protein